MPVSTLNEMHWNRWWSVCLKNRDFNLDTLSVLRISKPRSALVCRPNASERFRTAQADSEEGSTRNSS